MITSLPCGKCCFYREVLLDSQRMRRLCMLTGDKNDQLMHHGCHFIAGDWSRIDEILGLPKAGIFGNIKLPNQTKLGSGFSKNGRKIANTNFDIDDYTALPISHIAKAKRQFVRPGIREDPVARLARERTKLPFRI